MGNTASIEEVENGLKNGAAGTAVDKRNDGWTAGLHAQRPINDSSIPGNSNSSMGASASMPIVSVATSDGTQRYIVGHPALSNLTTPSSNSFTQSSDSSTTTPKASTCAHSPPKITAIPTTISRTAGLVQASPVAGSPLALSEIYSVSATGDSTSSSWIGRFLMSKRSRSIAKLADMAEHLQIQPLDISMSTSAPVTAVEPVSNGTHSSLSAFPWLGTNTLESSSSAGLFSGRRRSSSTKDPSEEYSGRNINGINIKAKPFVQPEGEQSYKNSARIMHSFGNSGFSLMAPLTRSDSQKRLIPIMINWPHGGRTVYLTGTFNNWKQKVKLSRSTDEFSTVVDMSPGTHRFKFIVDDEWKCSEDLPITSGPDGNLVNYLEVIDEDGDQQGDGLDGLSKLGDELEGDARPDSPIESYTSEIPAYLRNNQLKLHRNIVETLPFEPPPMLPAHLQKVLLNSKNVSNQDPYILPVPTHVTLNHLYACSIRDGVMAIGCTTRYKKKYITTVLYKPIFS
ncbi:galactose metabolism-related protein [Batrachochytrium dendrobatidis]|uniref:Association with the SNF1 complex (ASC) domain-containing protein n=2 Tax=Batrachochytrium dendrobatidis TaxID=109871 RepID=A0A177WJJ4_BATDL|nr:galactose metabolism- protein [Batrachochytrium dendrobatidis]KAK5673413.1 galactose metabolism-related protein [Batrachochytrium dendrobatidis]OAJ39875.1 hypothetical protein BDEG_23679 [Batrachochytrium dendrobatidis JEL423]